MAEVEIEVSGIQGVIPNFDEDLEILEGFLIEACLEVEEFHLMARGVSVNFTDASGSRGREIAVNVILNPPLEIKQEWVNKLFRKIIWLVYEFGKHCRSSTGLSGVGQAIRVTIEVPDKAVGKCGGVEGPGLPLCYYPKP